MALDVPVWFWASFLTVLGLCVGSFLNVVIWRIPAGGSIWRPRWSYCPRCEKPISPRDNVPVLSWLILRARCRNCGGPISWRYPVIEAATGGLFLLLFLGVFAGPLREDLPAWPANWPAVVATLTLAACLLAVSVIDLEHYFIPLGTMWVPGVVAVVAATVWPGAGLPIATSTGAAAWAVGGTAGLGLAILLLWLGVLPLSFPEEAGPEQGKEKSRADRKAEKRAARKAEKKRRKQAEQESGSRAKKDKRRRRGGFAAGPEGKDDESVGELENVRPEMLKEILFIAFPLLAGLLWWRLTREGAVLGETWAAWCQWPHLQGLAGALLGLLIGGGIVWAVRILGSLAFGREAMGLGDMHLMASAGTIIGWGGSLLAFFIAPFMGLAIAVIMFLRHRKRELPYGPYLSAAVLIVLLFYDRLAAWFAPSLETIFLGGGGP